MNNQINNEWSLNQIIVICLAWTSNVPYYKLNCIPDMILQSRLNGKLDKNLKKVANWHRVFYVLIKVYSMKLKSCFLKAKVKH